MNRKWRTNRGALDTVQPYPAFRESIPARDAPYSLADPTDLYAVYTVLHIESKQAELRWSSHGRFYFFLVQWEQPVEQTGVAAAPEGDEDPPPQIIPEGSEAALAQAAAAGQQQEQQQQGARKPGKLQRRALKQQQQQQKQQPQQPQQQQAVQQEQSGQQRQSSSEQAAPVPQAAASEAAAGAAAQPAAAEAAAAIAAPPATRLRTQIVVPVSSAYHELTPELLQLLFSVRGVQAQQLLLALVDSNGVVTRSCLYNYIQAPLEGPGTANLELLDD
ncbi:hypothetical protein ABPG77_008799 [Micractinium sp. CCAP 211/92]